ncbi:F-box domain [Dillenia turbinata]|uniref:F-box domain n=1 Tax=Dillenia turbinata TaxID=194707 RepID=A0AAN8W8P0_9MAGN
MSEFTEMFRGLPEELALDCLTRLPYSALRVATQVCHRWRQLIQSKDFYYHRRNSGKTHKLACLVQALPGQTGAHKGVGPISYGLTVFDPVTRSWDRVDSTRVYPNGLPLFCRVTSSEGKLVLIGGWHPVSFEPVRDTFVYEFTSQCWRKCKDMPSIRSFFAIGSVQDKVFIAGGHDENKNALNSAWVYDLSQDEWTELNQMSEERDECQGVVTGSVLWVVSGYGTDSQGIFKPSAEFFDLGTSQWKRVENAWTDSTQSPRSCAGVGKDGKMFCWSGSDSGLKVGACAVQCGDWTFLTGSAYQGGPQGFYLAKEDEQKEEREKENGSNLVLEGVTVPEEFLGFVQSGCCVEI